MVTPITKKSRKQVGVLFVDDTNMWEGLGKDDDIDTVMEKGEGSINSWCSNQLAVGGELQPDKCSCTVHEMKPTKDDGWGYVKETPNKPASKEETDTDKLDDI